MIHWTEFAAGFAAGGLFTATVVRKLANAYDTQQDREAAEWETTRDQREIEKAMRQKRIWQLPGDTDAPA